MVATAAPARKARTAADPAWSAALAVESWGSRDQRRRPRSFDFEIPEGVGSHDVCTGPPIGVRADDEKDLSHLQYRLHALAK
jgi:hypothetical protein